jgi:hypothetical protein
LTGIHPRCVVRAQIWAKGLPMKKTYEKPVLSKREKLSSVVAVALPSNIKP